MLITFEQKHENLKQVRDTVVEQIIICKHTKTVIVTWR